jgi:hypothetical protein
MRENFIASNVALAGKVCHQPLLLLRLILKSGTRGSSKKLSRVSVKFAALKLTYLARMKRRRPPRLSNP